MNGQSYKQWGDRATLFPNADSRLALKTKACRTIAGRNFRRPVKALFLFLDVAVWWDWLNRSNGSRRRKQGCTDAALSVLEETGERRRHRVHRFELVWLAVS